MTHLKDCVIKNFQLDSIVEGQPFIFPSLSPVLKLDWTLKAFVHVYCNTVKFEPFDIKLVILDLCLCCVACSCTQWTWASRTLLCSSPFWTTKTWRTRALSWQCLWTMQAPSAMLTSLLQTWMTPRSGTGTDFNQKEYVCHKHIESKISFTFVTSNTVTIVY